MTVQTTHATNDVQAVYFDLDGTLVNLYEVPLWCERLNQEDVTPYLEAQPLVNTDHMRMLLNQLSAFGVTVGVISWSAMHGSNAYNRATRKAKLAWCNRHFPHCFTEFHVVKYGTPKHYARKITNSVLVDDNAEVRKQWRGLTIDASNPQTMLLELEKLVDAVSRA